MADAETPTPQPAAADAPRPQLGIQTQYVKDLSFENPGAPESLAQTGAQPEIKVNVQVEAKALRDGVYEVSLSLSADARSGESPVFLVELTYNGVFSLVGVPQEAMQIVLLVECPRLLFPFARRIMADATRDGGFPPLMLSPIDFLALFRERQGATAQPQGQAPTPTASA